MASKKQLQRRIEGLRKANPKSEKSRITGLTRQLVRSQEELENAQTKINEYETQQRDSNTAWQKCLNELGPTEWTFILMLLRAPQDKTTIMVFADWLLDQNRIAEAAKLREVVNGIK